MAKQKKTNNDLQTGIQKTKYPAARTTLQPVMFRKGKQLVSN
jgi:hypothetical protein